MSTSARAPYPGLAPFQAADEPFFFSREAEARLIQANLRGSRFTVLYGASGVGKSSVLAAGVVAELRRLAAANRAEVGRPELAVALVRDWHGDTLATVTAALEAAVEQALGAEPAAPAGTSAGLDERLAAWSRALGGPVLLILDQFEDFLASGFDEGEEAFAAVLARAVERPGLGFHVLVALRDDALGLLDRLKGRVSKLFDHRLQLRPLTAEAAKRAIEGPLARLNEALAEEAPRFQAEPALVEEVLRQLTGDDLGVAAPYLQLVMARLWEAEQQAGSRVLRLATLRSQLGRVEHVVDDHVRRILGRLPAAERRTARRTLRYLVTVRGGRLVQSAADLGEHSGLAAGRIAPLLERLSAPDRRLLRPVVGPRPAEPGTEPSRSQPFEVYHDVLARPLLDWCREEEHRARLRRWLRRVAAAAVVVLLGLLGWERWQARLARNSRLDALPAIAASVDDPLLGALLLAESDPEREPPNGVQIANRLASQWLPERVLRGHTEAVASLAFSPDGERLVSGGADGLVLLWDLRDPGSPTQVAAHAGGVYCVAFDPKGRFIASGAGGGDAQPSVLISAVGGGQEARAIAVDGSVLALAFDAAGSVLAISSSTELVVWDLASWGPVAQLATTGSPLGTLAFGPPPRGWLAAGFSDGRLWIVDPASWALDRQLESTVGGLRHLAWSPSGHSLLLASREGGLDRVYLDDGSVERLSRESTYDVAVLGGQRLVAGSPDGSLALWQRDADRGPAARARGVGRGWVPVAASPDGGRIAAGDAEGRIWLFAARPPAYPARLTAAGGAVVHAAFASRSSELLVVTADGSHRRWHLGGSRRDLVADGRGRTSVLTAASALAPARLLTLGPRGQVELQEGDGEPRKLPATEPADPATAIALDPRGSFAVIGTRGGALRLVGLGTAASSLDLDREEDEVTALAVSPDGRSIVSGTAAGVVRLRAAAAGATARALAARDSAAIALAFDAQGQRLAIGWQSGEVILTSPGRGASAVEVPYLERQLRSLALSPDGRRLALGGASGRIRTWQPEAGQPPADLVQLAGEVLTLGFDSEGRQLVAGSSAGEVGVWTVSWPDLVEVLRRSTPACLAAADRVTYLAEPPGVAAAAFGACERAPGREGSP